MKRHNFTSRRGTTVCRKPHLDYVSKIIQFIKYVGYFDGSVLGLDLCGLTNAGDGSEDDFIHCFKAHGPIPEGFEMLKEARAMETAAEVSARRMKRMDVMIRTLLNLLLLICVRVELSLGTMHCLVSRPGYGLVSEECPPNTVACRIRIDHNAVEFYQYSPLYDRNQFVCVLKTSMEVNKSLAVNRNDLDVFGAGASVTPTSARHYINKNIHSNDQSYCTCQHHHHSHHQTVAGKERGNERVGALSEEKRRQGQKTASAHLSSNTPNTGGQPDSDAVHLQSMRYNGGREKEPGLQLCPILHHIQ
uniref:Uncharacterized protein n=1 Tax=Ditylenchus dipsaci TaxID=166011 RepID=A0A915DEW3_9BILA